MTMVKVVVLVVTVIVLYDAVVLVRALKLGSELARQSEPFSQLPKEPLARLLVVGDSTAVGTGASQPAETVAGRIGRAFPQVAIVNRGRDGAKTAAVTEQLGNPGDASFDAILIQVGGNDILRFTGVARLREDLEAVLRSAKAQTGLVVMMSTGDVGRAPAFPWPVDKYYSWKSKRVRQMILSLVAEEDVEFIDLYNPRPDNPFYRDPETYYAHDGLHPSGKGYGLWYDKLIAESSLPGVLADAP